MLREIQPSHDVASHMSTCRRSVADLRVLHRDLALLRGLALRVHVVYDARHVPCLLLGRLRHSGSSMHVAGWPQ